MTPQLRDQLQDTFGDAYTLLRELGGGGMSRVFLAEERDLGRQVVVKVLSSDSAGEMSAERFAREIRLVATLQQANIVPLLKAGISWWTSLDVAHECPVRLRCISFTQAHRSPRARGRARRARRR